MRKAICLFLIISFCCGCSSKPSTEKRQDKRDNIINVHDQIKGIMIEDVFISSYSWPLIIDDYIFIIDYQTANEYIHIIDKDNFKYVKSTALKGQGPGEIARIGHIAENKTNRKFYVSDYGKNKIFSYDLDSVIIDSIYHPVQKIAMNEQLFPVDYVYVNDTLSIGMMIEPIGNNDFTQLIGRFNMKTGEINLMSYTVNPKVKKKRIFLAVSMQHGVYVECYVPHDLMTICSLDGELKYNVYGPDWDTETYGTRHYGDVEFCNNRIVALYSGKKRFTEDIRAINPTKFIVFDLEGNYLKTLETDYPIIDFCYDQDNNRIIMSMDDEMQYVYLDMDGLLD